MSRTGIRIATLGAFSGGLLTAFFALSPTAAAEPAPAAPSVPGVDFVQQLANAPAMASQLLQNAATMLSPTPPAAAPAAPAASPAPTATGSINLPQLPGMTPASAPMTSQVGTVPGAPAPAAPASSMPLLNQLPLPGSIASIAQAIPGIGTNPAAIPSITAPMSTGPMTPPAATPGAPGLPPTLDPFSALP